MRRASKCVRLVLITSATLLLGCGRQESEAEGSDFDENEIPTTQSSSGGYHSYTHHYYGNSGSGFFESSSHSFSSGSSHSSSAGTSHGGFGSSGHAAGS